MDFQNKVVVITGGSSGIGEASGLEFAKRKSSVFLVSRSKENLNISLEKINKISSDVLTYQCDVSKNKEVESMSRWVLDKYGKIDILVNNAGFGTFGSVLELKIEDQISQMETNFFGMIYCIKSFLPTMLERRSGHIVNVASLAGSFGIPGMVPYCASKFAMLGYSEGLYHELKGSGVGVTVVSPITVKTNFFNDPSFRSIYKNSLPSLSPETVAKAILKASNSPRLEIVVPQIARVAILLKQTLPFLINPIISSVFTKKINPVINYQKF